MPEVTGLRRLTVPQYQNSIVDLFGSSMAPTTEFERDDTVAGFASVAAAQRPLSSTITEQFVTSAAKVAKDVLANAALRTQLVSCAPATATTDDNCTQTFIRTIGRKAWRRPLADDEVKRYADVATEAQTTLNSYFGGLEYGLAGILSSPYFLYRNELGTPDPSNGKQVIFNDYELATRLSFFLWNSTPDDQLLDAAQAKQLTQGNGLTMQAQRLLMSPRAAQRLQNFFSDLYHLGDLDNMPQQQDVFPQVKTMTLGAAMRAETLAFLNDIAFVRGGDFREIFDSRATFVNAELAKLYGLSGVTGTAVVPTMLPADGMRAGLLGQGSFLAGNSAPSRSSPTLRGKYIREMILCQAVPPAPPSGVPDFPTTAGLTTREKLKQHRENAGCAACHVLMDPLGLGLENFDGIGVFRTTEVGKTIDASGDVNGVAFSGPRELATLLKNDKDTAACMARHAYRYATGHVETTGEEPAITVLAQGFAASAYQFRALLEGVVKSPGFVLAAKAE